ncbi:UbiA prenyltransferase family-domain-containing protein [Xylariaceae sp. FL1019]|nr:UbiA prenyltransferase family-domain-containing protein [Xylariaceae sp. FL1019]
MSFRPVAHVFGALGHGSNVASSVANGAVALSVCWRCVGREPPRASRALPAALSPARSFSHSAPASALFKPTPARLNAGYFISNDHTSSRSPNDPAAVPIDTSSLPHRRRQRRQNAEKNTSNGATTTTSTSSPIPSSIPPSSAPATSSTEQILPDNASSTLTTASEKSTSSLRRQLSLYLSLSKPRLTVLVTLTAMAPYALYPVPDFLSPTVGLDTPSLSPMTLAFLTTGTALCIASANTLNMLYEVSYDALMSRTRNRPLVRGLLSRPRALAFALLGGVAGVVGLYYGVNPTVAFLGFANILLYAGVYTPLKRVSWLNTWVGAVVGGIPPLMGWAAAAGEYATEDGFRALLLVPEAVGGWLFAALLFAWQFPHFMALSWSIRDEYKIAGHQMLCWVNPSRNGRVALRYSLAFIPICIGLCYAGVTEWSFAVTSLPVNIWLVREAVKFWRHEGFKGSARGLFWASVWHMPAVMVLALVQKKGMWERVWRAVLGNGDEEDEEEEEENWEDEGWEENTVPIPVAAKKS